ncbi:hypothetical protein H4R33_001109 [Dimargaris cristalligena]|uniref:Sas10/Utp3/C1D family-domain-containing protein n=1 Tax=Dimargaris cristalligena TaxID=215637 RepID=A0A4Q0A4J8_9FUNG|nr:hypothetical protein H4R33_001109 [Dimargaris cristalligena]RKP40180.1 Sas10/Utp3/C1D family-domain-containing protein [Dimargaris cristalligena]|eukprot:RKP40180.1 Sas10/Utp3/C1D family-domain-containing protein [Dimargaris cristalligena]
MDSTAVTPRLEGMLAQLEAVQNHVTKLSAEIHDNPDQSDTSEGISLLEVKYHLLLEYLTNVVYIMHRKLQGESIVNHPVIDKLIEDRVYLEKIRPLEVKIKYQVDKLLRAASLEHPEQAYEKSQKAIEEADPLQFKPNLSGMQAISEKINNSASRVTGKSQVYQPPRVAPTHFEEDPRATAKRKRYEEHLQRKAQQSSIVREIMADLDDRPEREEVHGNSGLGGSEGYLRKLKERTTYEEDNFTRLQLTRKDRIEAKKSQYRQLEHEFNNLNDFANSAALRSIQKTGGQSKRESAPASAGPSRKPKTKRFKSK